MSMEYITCYMDASSIDKYGDCNLQIHALYYTKCWTCGTCPIRTFMASAVTKFTFAFLFYFF